MKKLSSKRVGQIQVVGFYVGIGVVLALLVYTTWQISRHINYNLSYKDMVQETICETVKHENMINPELCEKL